MTTKEVWTKYSNDLKRFIMSKVKNTDATDDVLQNTFIKIHTKLHTINDLTKLKPWIFTIARNSIIDYFKATKQTFDVSNFDIPTEETNNIHSEEDCLRGILKNLPKKYRDPLFLSDIKGMKQAAIAAQLSLPLATVKSQIQRGRKLIVQGYMDCCDYKLNDKGFLTGEIKDIKQCKVCN